MNRTRQQDSSAPAKRQGSSGRRRLADALLAKAPLEPAQQASATWRWTVSSSALRMGALPLAACCLTFFLAVAAAAPGWTGSAVAAAAIQDGQEALRMLESGQYGQAEEAFRSLQEEGRLKKQWLDQAVEASRQLNHWERVVELYRAFPLDIPQRVELYEALLRAGRQEEARQELLALRRERPGEERFVHLLAFLHLNRGQTEEASQVYAEFLQDHPQAYESHVNRALVLFSMQRTDEAIGHLKTAFDEGGEEANLHFYQQLARNMKGMSEAQLAQLGDDVRQAAGLPGLGVRGHLLLGREFSRLNRYPPAIEGYGRYLEAHPQDDQVRYDLARLYFLQGDSQQARATLDPLIDSQGTDGDRARLFAAELAVKEEDYEAASGYLGSLPSAYHDQGLYRYLSARVALQQGDTEKACSLLESVVEKHPEIEEAFFHLGQLYLRQGRREEGRRLLQQFQRRKP
ncbi:MAG TPA: tetratricopeptide repeat protein [Acidobacteriota bacterium]|nr:tetratricopeptide repeat protein [Acidobacteriota bacterium]